MKKNALLARMAAVDAVIAEHRKKLPKADGDWRRAKEEAALMSAETLSATLDRDAQEAHLLRIGIVGRVKAGKSSLLNGLLFDGEEVLPKAATPMTASLAVLSYGDALCAEVEFYDRAEIDRLEADHAQYEEELEQKVQEIEERVAQAASGPGRGSGLFARSRIHAAKAAPDTGRVRARAQQEMARDTHLAGAYELYELLKKQGVDEQLLGAKRQIKARSLADLHRQLKDYVAVGGKYMPLTKALRIELPSESLRGIEVVDTPGVNDPVASREERTRRELRNCAAVLLVSNAGQFLNEDDFSLMDRLESNSISEVFLVASQADTQLMGHLHQDHGDQFGVVLHQLHDTLIRQAEGVLAQRAVHHRENASKALARLVDELRGRLLLSSGVAQALLTQPRKKWDENTQLVHTQLTERYPAAFTTDAAQTHLAQLAGTEGVKRRLEQVRDRRVQLQEEQAADRLVAQVKALDKALEFAVARLEVARDNLHASKAEALAEGLKALKAQQKKGIAAADLAYREVVNGVAESAGDSLAEIIKNVIDHATGKANRAKGSRLETYTVEKAGFGNWLARLINLGGTEEVSRLVEVLRGGEVREAIEHVQARLNREAEDLIRALRKKMRAELQRELTRTLRNSLGDENVDRAALDDAIRNTLDAMPDALTFELPLLPEELKVSGDLHGSTAERVLMSAREYLKELEKGAKASAANIAKSFRAVARRSTGKLLMDSYAGEIELRQQELKGLEKTLKCYDGLISGLKQV